MVLFSKHQALIRFELLYGEELMWLHTNKNTSITTEPATPEIAAPTIVALAAPKISVIPTMNGILTRYAMNPSAYPRSQNPNTIGPRPI